MFTSKERLVQFPGAENHICSVEDYEALLRHVGFENVLVEDVTEKVWGGHFLNMLNMVYRAYYKGEISAFELTDISW